MSHKSKPRKILLSFFAKVDGGQSSNEYDAFIVDGCKHWKYVSCGKKCHFTLHEQSHNSFPNAAMVKWSNLKDPSRHIDKRMNAYSSQQVLENRLRGHDESVNSLNRQNFMELIKLLATMNEEINEVVLENASKNAQYIAPKIQNELLNILANKVQHKIRALDESHKKKMAIILRYVDCDGFIRERFFEVVNVDDIKASTLKNEICNVLARYNLLVENLRGQGHDGASNMSREWNGLQFLFLNDCPFVYYVHCFTHRLQLVLVAVSKKVHDIELLEYLIFFANHYKTKSLDILNALNTRWSLYFTSVSRLIKMFSATLKF
ncbi:hypothetical protein CICLE_v10004015mg [Citrus x clementina]|uniref:DUF4371 domain-containing protein n=1 Tax=Citrus clementina TaxID=85681 RepID=V4T7V0_CITCL|nr:hypothetical protein CICLE_v10004015mg [Citrus x clementina]